MSKAKKDLPIKSVIFKFRTVSNAERFFGAFSDRAIKNIEKSDEIKKAVDSLMGYCGINSVDTKLDPEYGVGFIECNI